MPRTKLELTIDREDKAVTIDIDLVRHEDGQERTEPVFHLELGYPSENDIDAIACRGLTNALRCLKSAHRNATDSRAPDQELAGADA